MDVLKQLAKNLQTCAENVEYAVRNLEDAEMKHERAKSQLEEVERKCKTIFLSFDIDADDVEVSRTSSSKQLTPPVENSVLSSRRPTSQSTVKKMHTSFQLTPPPTEKVHTFSSSSYSSSNEKAARHFVLSASDDDSDVSCALPPQKKQKQTEVGDIVEKTGVHLSIVPNEGVEKLRKMYHDFVEGGENLDRKILVKFCKCLHVENYTNARSKKSKMCDLFEEQKVQILRRLDRYEIIFGYNVEQLLAKKVVKLSKYCKILFVSGFVSAMKGLSDDAAKKVLVDFISKEKAKTYDDDDEV